VIDRYSDVVLFFGILVYYARSNHLRYVVLTAFVMVTSLMVSYTRARAEALIGSCKVGFMERPERIVLIILGALFQWAGVMAPVLWVLAILSTITVVHRIQYTYWNTKHLAPVSEVPKTKLAAAAAQPAPGRQAVLARDKTELPS
jgi:CDP-diacylglycerol--glycerol-3-phosphate 3-phosphatidyltransferase